MASSFDPKVYGAILRTKQAYRFDAGCFLMRFYMYMTNIGTITMLTLSGYSFFMAGLISSAIAVATFLITPRVSKLVDTYGQGKVVPIASTIAVLGIVGIVANVALGGPEWVCFIATIFMGFAPSPQALARARWTYLIRTGKLGPNPPELRTMFSYESILDDIGFMCSPSVSIALAAALFPTAGMIAGALGFVLGSILLCSSRSTEPEVAWDTAMHESEGVGEEGKRSASGKSGSTSSVSTRQKSMFRTSPVVRILFLLLLFAGAYYGVFDTATVALAEELGDPGIASVILVIQAIISMMMGLVFGMVQIHLPHHKQLVIAACAIGLAYGSMALIDSATSLFIVAIIGAFFYAPFLIVGNATCERAVPGDRLTESITWMNAGVTCGMAFGPSIGGMIIDVMGTMYAFDFGAILAIAIPVTALLSYKTLKRALTKMAATRLS